MDSFQTQSEKTGYLGIGHLILLVANRVHLVQNSFSHYKHAVKDDRVFELRQIRNCPWVRTCMILVWRDLLCKYVGQPWRALLMVKWGLLYYRAPGGLDF